jgi:hypothetical protein
MILWTNNGRAWERWDSAAALAKRYGLKAKRITNQLEARGSFATSIVCAGLTIYTEDPHGLGQPDTETKKERPRGGALLRTPATHGIGVWRDIPR